MSRTVRPSIGVRISGTGMALPPRVLTNADLARRIDSSDEWIRQRTGIRERRIADGDVTVRQLAGDALAGALEQASIPARELDLVFCATLTPEMCCPATSVRMAAELGATEAGAMDISAACSGFVYGLNLAASMIETGRARHVGVVGVEMLSRITDWDDRRTCILFGDGAGAAVLSADDDPQRGCLYQQMGADGSQWDLIYCPRSPDDLPADSNGFNGKFNTLQMKGREVYRFAVARLQKCIDEALAACDKRPEDLAMVVAHQSNQRILESARQRLGLPESRFYINIDRFGNTSAASVALCLHELRAADRVGPGDLVLFVGIGGGLTWASSLWQL